MAIENVDNTDALQKLKDDNLAATGAADMEAPTGEVDDAGEDIMETPPPAAKDMADGFADAAAAYIDDVVLTQVNDERVALLAAQNVARQEALDQQDTDRQASQDELEANLTQLIVDLTARVTALEASLAGAEGTVATLEATVATHTTSLGLLGH